MRLEFCVPVKTVSEANAHEHWRVRAKRAKAQRAAARLACDAAMRQLVAPIIVHLTRVGVRKLDSDNLHGSCKHLRDGIADSLGINDGRDDLVTWQYAQRTGGCHVEVVITDSREVAE